MAISNWRSVALIIVGACFLAVTVTGCFPKKLTTSETGRTGMPTAVFDKGVPPEAWGIDRELLPIYPEAKKFGSWRTYITEDSTEDVFAWYKEKLPDAEVELEEGAERRARFTSDLFILEISLDEIGKNTLITFSRPPE